MKPQLDKIRAEAAFDEDALRSYYRKNGVGMSPPVGFVGVGRAENARLNPIIEKLLRVIECQDDAAEEAIARLGDFGDLYSSRPLRLAQAEVLRILEGS